MLPTLHKKPSASQPFNLLVGHLAKSSDPSKGYNSEKLRYGFKTQLFTTPRGNGLYANFDNYNPTVIIKVNSNAYANHLLDDTGVALPGGTPIPPEYEPDIFQIFSDNINEMELLASLEVGSAFGRDQGNGFGNASDIASSLADAINDVEMNLSAEVDPDDNTQVKVTSYSVIDDIFIQVSSFTYDIWGGDSPFIIKNSDGDILFDGTADTLLGKKVIIKDNGVSPMVSLNTETLANEFGNFLKEKLNFPITKAKTSLTKIHYAYLYNNEIVISYDPSANTDGAKFHITIENLTNNNTDDMRFTGSNKYDNNGNLLYTFGTLEGNKNTIKTFVNTFLVAEGYDPI